MYLLQIIACFVYAIVMICAIKNFKRTIIAWGPLSLLFNPQVCVTYAPAIALTVAVNISLVGLYIVFQRKAHDNKRFNNEKFLLKSFMAFMLVSILISSLFSVVPFTASFKVLIKSTIMEFGMIYIFFRCVSTYDDIRLYIKTCIFVSLIIIINGLIENFTSINPVGDFIYYTSPHTDDMFGRSFYVPGMEKLRYGLKRCYSVFNLHITFGITCTILFFILFIYYRIKRPIFKQKTKAKNYLIIICLCLLPIGVILSNSKTPMLGFMILLLAFYRLSQLFNFKLMFPLIIGCVLIVIYVPDYINNFLSLFDDDLAEEGGGSTVALREDQLSYIVKLFEQSPIWGNGMNAAAYYSENVYEYAGILGAESKWFKLLAEQGILGILAYLYMYICCYRFGDKIIPRRVLLFFLFSILVMETVTGGVNNLLWLPVFIVLKQLYQLRNNYVKELSNTKLLAT